jgi:hypothetical protein
MNRRDFLQASASVAAFGLAPHAHSHHHTTEAAFEGAAPGGAAIDLKSPVVSGEGDFRYRYFPEKLALPGEVKMKNGHGPCHDTEGNIYFTFEPETVVCTWNPGRLGYWQRMV